MGCRKRQGARDFGRAVKDGIILDRRRGVVALDEGHLHIPVSFLFSRKKSVQGLTGTRPTGGEPNSLFHKLLFFVRATSATSSEANWFDTSALWSLPPFIPFLFNRFPLIVILVTVGVSVQEKKSMLVGGV